MLVYKVGRWRRQDCCGAQPKQEVVQDGTHAIQMCRGLSYSKRYCMFSSKQRGIWARCFAGVARSQACRTFWLRQGHSQRLRGTFKLLLVTSGSKCAYCRNGHPGVTVMVGVVSAQHSRCMSTYSCIGVTRRNVRCGGVVDARLYRTGLCD